MRSRGGVAGITTDKKAQKKERDLEEKLLEAGPGASSSGFGVWGSSDLLERNVQG